eukprot:TRINITY_DN7393_c0_g1_i3.p1 TRINITY_DN7393_c0_g1~~TRINITY_DN7393_c0_g1_i3.p1  ORF type:complete len:379 (-),score=29.98 TRINITY_DN7393_c0_g1_i3:372-1508(-)
MFNPGLSDSKSYGVKYQARCVVAQASDGDRSRFLVGTLSLREENEIHVIESNDSTADIFCDGLYVHQHEIWDLAACPFDYRLFSTVYAAEGEYAAAIWRIPGEGSSAAYGGRAPPQLELAADLKGFEAPIICVLWYPRGRHHQVISLDEWSMRVWDFEEGKSLATVESEASAGELQQISCGCWDPYSISSVATASDSKVNCWDLRTMQQSVGIDQAHLMQVRDMEFSPEREKVLMTAGDDARIRLWDLRSANRPLLELPGHLHWTWRARFNPFYGDLILSSGTDTVVNLWHVPKSDWWTGRRRTPSLSSSAKSPGGKGNDSAQGQQDQPVQSYTEHEDSVYGIAWSLREPWVFASLSYDGRVMVNKVPKAIRNQVLNL